MIIIDDPNDLPKTVRRYRQEVLGRSLGAVATEAADARFQDVHVVKNHWSRWETGDRSLRLHSLTAYLRAHGLRLALVPADEPTDSQGA